MTLPRSQVKGLYWAVVGFFVAVVLLAAPLLWLSVENAAINRHQTETDQRLEALIEAEEREGRVEGAVACVGAHEAREYIRDMAEATYRRNAETLLGFASSADPRRVQAYADQVELDVAEIRSELPAPDCDLAAAQAVIDNQQE